jgi:hypothetical protein
VQQQMGRGQPPQDVAVSKELRVNGEHGLAYAWGFRCVGLTE